jgi:omega-amidase
MNWFKIAGIQFGMKWEDKVHNFSLLRELMRGITGKDLILLPETFSTGFTMNSKLYSEKQLGQTECFLLEMAQKTNALVGGGWIEENLEGLPYNTFSLVSPEGNFWRYRKIHPFSFAGEDQYFSAGSEVLTFAWRGVNITPLVCYDLRFPEVFRSRVGKTDLFAVIGNWPSSRIHHWLALLKARAIENQSYTIGVNRVGVAGKVKKLSHNGYSGFFSPTGTETVLQSESQDILEVSFSMDELKRVREEFPYLKDIRGVGFNCE